MFGGRVVGRPIRSGTASGGVPLACGALSSRRQYSSWNRVNDIKGRSREPTRPRAPESRRGPGGKFDQSSALNLQKDVKSTRPRLLGI
jgi:hypothetical protein